MPDSSNMGRSRSFSSFFTDPAIVVLGVTMIFGGIGIYTSDQVNNSHSQQEIVDLNNTIADMKANLLPKRVQALEDEFTSMQQATASQFQSMQASIQSIQNASQQANQTLTSSIRDMQSQVALINNNVTSISVRLQYGESPSPDGSTPYHR